MAITRDLEIMIRNDTASFRDNMYVYQNDKNVELYISIRDHKYRRSENNELIKSLINAYANATILKPNGDSFKTHISSVIDGKIKFIIKEEFTDELDEVGIYKMQFHLYDDENETSRITIPSVEFEVKELIANIDNSNSGIVGEGEVDKAIVQKEGISITLNITNDEIYVKTDWKTGDLITASKLNKIEKGIETLEVNDSEINKKLELKVTREDGKVLSENSFTNEDKLKLAETVIVTDEEKEIWNNKSDFTGKYEDLEGKPILEQGPIGPVGPQGIEGPKGKDGLNGKDGKDGEKGEQGLIGPRGATGTFDINLEIPGLPTEDKTMPGAIKEVFELATSIVNRKAEEGELVLTKLVNITGNKINYLTKITEGITIVQVEIRAAQDISAGTILATMPQRFIPKNTTIINPVVGGVMASGFIRKNGDIVIGSLVMKDNIINISSIVVN